MIGAVAPLAQGIDADAVVAGFAFGLLVALLVWAALVGLSIVRRLLD
jgi:hypothetical protein